MSVSINGTGSITGIDQGFNVTSGSVGIGTDVVGDKLVIHQGSDDDVIVRVNGADSSSEFAAMGVGSGYAAFVAGGTGTTNTDMVLMTSPSGVETERLRITSGGNITYGNQSTSTANNSSALVHISAGKEYWSGTAGDYRALKHRIYDNTIDDAYGMGVSASLLEIQAQANIGFFAGTAGSGTGRRIERLRITSGGYVGINETSPDTYLHVKTGTDSALVKLEQTATNGRAQVQYLNPHGDWIQGIQGATNTGDYLIYTGQSKNLTFYTSGALRQKIQGDGKVIIGGNANQVANRDLSVVAASGNSNNTEIGLQPTNSSGGYNPEVIIGTTADGTYGADMFFTTRDTSGNRTERLRIKSNGHIHIGNPIELRNVATTTHTFALSGNNDNTFSCPGSVSISGATAYNTANYAGGGLRFLGKYNTAGQYTTFAHVGGIKENTTNGNYAGALTFHTRSNGGLGAERMRISSNGQVTMPSQPCFWATSNTGGSNTNTGYHGIISNQFEAAYVNVGNHYNTSTGVFTCPVAGVYEFHGQGLARYQSGTGNLELTFYKNGSNTMSRSYGYTYVTGTSDHDNLHVMAYITCAVNDQIDLRTHALASGVDCYFAQGLGYFAGRLVQ